MPTGSNPELMQTFAAALDWWREAGVDCDFLDEPRQWIADGNAATNDPKQSQVEERSAKPAPPDSQQSRRLSHPEAAPTFVPEDLSRDLGAFREWWMREPALDDGRTGQRVPPRGEAGADLMVLVPEPESIDRDRLLSGGQGKVLEGFFHAAAIDPASVYHASFFPRHSPGADWRGAEAAAIAPAVLRHIMLANPKRLIVLGFNVLPLLGNEPPQAPASLANLKHESATIPLLAARALDGMDRRPSWKAAFWQAWLDWHRA